MLTGRSQPGQALMAISGNRGAASPTVTNPAETYWQGHDWPTPLQSGHLKEKKNRAMISKSYVKEKISFLNLMFLNNNLSTHNKLSRDDSLYRYRYINMYMFVCVYM